jgi:hypothetical protein
VEDADLAFGRRGDDEIEGIGPAGPPSLTRRKSQVASGIGHHSSPRVQTTKAPSRRQPPDGRLRAAQLQTFAVARCGMRASTKARTPRRTVSSLGSASEAFAPRTTTSSAANEPSPLTCCRAGWPGLGSRCAAPPRPAALPELLRRPRAGTRSSGREDPDPAGPGYVAGGNAPSWPWWAISSARGFAPVVGTEFRLVARPKPGWSEVVDCEVLELNEPSLLRYSWTGEGEAT